MCHNELNFSSYNYQGLGDENNEHEILFVIYSVYTLSNLKIINHN